MAEAFLETKIIEVPTEFKQNARRFLYYQLFYSSLPFDAFLEEDGVWPGFVRLRAFNWKHLLPQNSAMMSVILDGLLKGGNFMWRDPLN